MASLSSLAALSLLFLFCTPAVRSATTTCPPQKFKNNKIFANCTSLPALSAALHYTFNATNSSLSVAFVAAAPGGADGGWVGWGINPNGTGMAGTQALIALKPSSAAGGLVVKTFNLVSYGSIKEEKLSFDVWDLAAESLSGGATAIFASVKLPAGADRVNHVWQVGATVTNGLPGKHDFGPPNLAAKQTLQLTGGAAPAPASSPALGSTPGGSPPASAPGNGTSGGYRMRELKLGSYVGVFVLLAGLIGF
ncbi:unnamed protein product [Linum tenue]|uniref:DOMON domain-containing protein n=1 Tax=Linum tenue TaxID=586396 RepID=A0AAV0MUN8_9ROSI|nr:unnamed protein product [Linum tenue]